MNPLYFKLKAKICSGSLKLGEQLPSIRKASEAEKLAFNTVWTVYKKLVEEGYLSASERSSYTVCYNANAFLTKPILYVLSKTNIKYNVDHLYRKITETFKAKLSHLNCHLEVYVLNHLDEKYLLEHLNSNLYSGLIIDEISLPIIEKFRNLNLPIVLIDAPLNSLNVNSVVQSNFYGASQGVQILLKNKPASLIWVGPIRGHSHCELRYAGANSALTLMSRRFDQEIFIDFDAELSINKIKEVLDVAKKPIGICSYWRAPTQLIFEYCKSNKLVIGKDLFLTAWCCQELYDIWFAKYMEPNWEMTFITWSIQDLVDLTLKNIFEKDQNHVPSEQNLPTYIKTVSELIKNKP